MDDPDEGQPVPAGYHRGTKIRVGLVAGGASTFGALWLLTAVTSTIVADASGNGNAALGAIPVAGPFALIPQVSGSPGATSADLFFVLDGLGQIAGVAMLVAGLAAPRKVFIRNDIGKVTILPKPISFGRNGGGFGLVGTF
jgi:hypothetical protein